MLSSFFLQSLLFIIFIHSSSSPSQFIPDLGLDPDPGLEGQWQLLHKSVGISAMHMQLLRNNKVVIFDRTDFGSSNLTLPAGQCRFDPNEKVLLTDCSAHSILYDIYTNRYRPLMVQTDTWCSSGTVLPQGTLVQTGGFNDGDLVVRTFDPCNGEFCDWIEFPGYLSKRRWYASNQLLPDGRVIIVGGRDQFNYEFYPKIFPGEFRPLYFLKETKDEYENNLYPFVHLLPDGNLFIFANTRAILYDYINNRLITEFPPIPGGDPRNYPSSGSSVLLPLDDQNLQPEIIICGGAPQRAVERAIQGAFLRTTSTCGRLKIKPTATWTMENMPLPRVMGDMLILPDGNLIIINGAGSGVAGWESARDPVTRPVIYRPGYRAGSRFAVMAEAARPRLYHSTAILLTDGRVLVGGSNPHVYYNFTGVDYPTDLSLEAFTPPYLSPLYDSLRPRTVELSREIIGYNRPFSVDFEVSGFLKMAVVTVRIVAPAFNTHAFSMNQRMVVLKVARVSWMRENVYCVSAVGPSTAEVAPPGYYLLFVVHGGIPGAGMWVKIQ
ncbi:aldehyde oxidase GLOX [Andrographis paniculata]|uniref:aldehyde oxidase GLOX n=1 Tax=Andrographis paniculata TaxID=175694 RepID=UPI0021E7FAF5|nr:aldehyde oxidase GLOX [Andrographis paniculata]